MDTEYLPSIRNDELEEAVVQQFKSQNPFHGAMAEVWRQAGGMDLMTQVAQKSPEKFLRLMMAMTPNMQPVSGIQGEVHILVDPSLCPSPLDVGGGSTLDNEPDGDDFES